jgi:hypothetical protein
MSTRFIFSILALAALAGCGGSMTLAECRSADWLKLGERDGLQYGLRPQIEIYAKRCRPHGIQPAEEQYMTGWRDGYAEYNRRLGGLGIN